MGGSWVPFEAIQSSFTCPGHADLSCIAIVLLITHSSPHACYHRFPPRTTSVSAAPSIADVKATNGDEVRINSSSVVGRSASSDDPTSAVSAIDPSPQQVLIVLTTSRHNHHHFQRHTTTMTLRTTLTSLTPSLTRCSYALRTPRLARSAWGTSAPAPTAVNLAFDVIEPNEDRRPGESMVVCHGLL